MVTQYFSRWLAANNQLLWTNAAKVKHVTAYMDELSHPQQKVNLASLLFRFYLGLNLNLIARLQFALSK